MTEICLTVLTLVVCGSALWFGLTDLKRISRGKKITTLCPQVKELSGKTKSELLKALGLPRSVETYSGGRSLARWRISDPTNPSSVAVLFDENDEFIGMSSEVCN